LLISEANNDILIKAIDKIEVRLSLMAEQYANIAMVSRTHGQVATPTTVGKELANYAYRIHNFKTKMQGVVSS